VRRNRYQRFSRLWIRSLVALVSVRPHERSPEKNKNTTMNRIHYYCLASAIALGGFAASGEESASRDSESTSPDRAVRERRISVPQFEYLVETVQPQDSVQHVLNKLGLEGWELVSVSRFDQRGSTTLYLKRTSRSPQTQPKNE
jgi:uncharacterized protein (DUF1697 family)